MSEPRTLTAEVAVGQQLELGESVRWLRGSLHWVDVPTGRRFRWAGGSSPVESFSYDGVLTAVFDAGEGAVGVVGRDAVEIPAGGTITRIPLGIDEGRSNDARVDPAGALWVGTLMPDPLAGQARLLRVGDDVTVLRERLTMSNGIGFAGELAYHVDTFARTVNRYRLDRRGGIAEQTEFATMTDALPDGLTVDADGGVWVALWGAGCARRYDPSGRCTHEVRTPGASQVTSVALGGADGRDLFLTTAGEDVDEPHAGALFHARAETCGVREHVFRVPENPKESDD